MQERFNPNLRRQSMALAKDPNLHVIIHQVLASIVVYPELDSPEAYALDESLKPLRYAVIARAIEKIIGMPQIVEPANFEDRYERSGFNLLGALLAYEYHGRRERFMESEENAEILSGWQAIADARNQTLSIMWSSPEWALSGGIGTFIDNTTVLMGAFNGHLDRMALSPEAKKTILLKSYSNLIDVANYDTLQLWALTMTFAESQLPAVGYDAKANRVGFLSSPLDLELSEKTKAKIVEYEPGLDINRPMTVADASINVQILGCPILFNPNQVKKVWQHAVNTAYELGILSAQT